jgi:hypothetical protein
MHATAEHLPLEIEACECLVPFGRSDAAVDALLVGRRALALTPVLGEAGGDPVPLALMGPLDESLPPRWLDPVSDLVRAVAPGGWGGPRRPVIVTSSNFGVGNLYAFTRDRDARHLDIGTPFASVELLRRTLAWGEHVQVFSHACVTAHLGLVQAGRMLHAGLADEVLVCSFDFVSPFVAGGFHSLKILNGEFPAPYAIRPVGSIGLGDGAAVAVLRKPGAGGPRGWHVAAQSLHNEMYHFTSNQPDGSGFAACTAALAAAAAGRRVWLKGHGTGTLEAGKLEAESLARAFPGAPLVSWKGSLGHTLGSCGLVELALTLAALRRGRIPGTVGGQSPGFTDTVALEPFDASAYDGAVLTSNAFGGAHAGLVLAHA